MKLTAKRHQTLKRLEGGKLLKWQSGSWGGEPVVWWVDGSFDQLHPATCMWLIRNGFAEYDEPYNDASMEEREARNEWGIMAYHITDKGKQALRVNGPKATVLKFRPRAA